MWNINKNSGSNKMTQTVNTNNLTPKLRFPEFKDCGEWTILELSKLAKLITEKAGNNNYTPMSVTSGKGLVPQKEKFGREIAGGQFRNYYVIKKWNFAYNKSATNLYPEGFITLLKDYDIAAVPNSIFTCFQVNEKIIYPLYLDFLFQNNYHGKWLRKFIEIGARAHGSLSIDSKILFKLPIVFPSLPEQQKIADCLTSIDEVIAAHTRKLELLKAQKKGLMQNLFPQDGEKMPKFRFKEFEKDGEWEEKPLGKVCKMQAGKFVNASEINEYCTENLFPCYGGNGLRGYTKSYTHYGTYSLIGRQGALCGNVILVNDKFYATEHALVTEEVEGVHSIWLYYLLLLLNLNKYATGQAQPGLSVNNIEQITIFIPQSTNEQQKIADCLTSLDDLIIATSEKLEALQAHKKGLMQQLFPKI